MPDRSMGGGSYNSGYGSASKSTSSRTTSSSSARSSTTQAAAAAKAAASRAASTAATRSSGAGASLGSFSSGAAVNARTGTSNSAASRNMTSGGGFGNAAASISRMTSGGGSGLSAASRNMSSSGLGNAMAGISRAMGQPQRQANIGPTASPLDRARALSRGPGPLNDPRQELIARTTAFAESPSGQRDPSFASGLQIAALAGARPLSFKGTPQQQELANRILSPALHVGIRTGLDPRTVIGQALTESTTGRNPTAVSKLASNYNNLFGVKATGSANDYWSGDSVNMPTKEVVDGRTITVQQPFRSYETPAQSVLDYGRLIEKRYSEAGQQPTIEKQLQAIRGGGYATHNASDYVRMGVANAGKLALAPAGERPSPLQQMASTQQPSSGMLKSRVTPDGRLETYVDQGGATVTPAGGGASSLWESIQSGASSLAQTAKAKGAEALNAYQQGSSYVNSLPGTPEQKAAAIKGYAEGGVLGAMGGYLSGGFKSAGNKVTNTLNTATAPLAKYGNQINAALGGRPDGGGVLNMQGAGIGRDVSSTEADKFQTAGEGDQITNEQISSLSAPQKAEFDRLVASGMSRTEAYYRALGYTSPATQQPKTIAYPEYYSKWAGLPTGTYA